MPALLRKRLLELDDVPDAKPTPRRSFEDTLKHMLLKTYPVAPVVEEVDDVFARRLERMAALELDEELSG